MIRARRTRTRADPTVSLINIVFLILIFFMVAGTLAKLPQREIALVESRGLECCAPPDALGVSRDGALHFNGRRYATVAAYLAVIEPGEGPLRILPDRRLPARELLTILARLRAAGAEKIVLLTQDVSA
ncbi:ExbD/TolR family protein [Stakelama tenebrarum]|uniref:Biopolymer transporter ExbD n=1 Tax=Stakelama tenebrarum TaxID=2711215 RepID=A0A6G6Y1F3_9SPHN|nr:biopolymer transporter ExbD [Sphingosinithalassobacter tenebrarum]QIG78755.1 biopolymer transporter ExbD [Sphingosinithalassobacter tenebrarum]